MFTHPDRMEQLAREHHHQMLAEASQWRLRHQCGRPAASTRIIRRLAAAIARTSVVTAQVPAPSGPTERTGSANQPPGFRF